MAREAIVQSTPNGDDRERDAALRPRWLREVIGQRAVVQRLGIVINACKKLKEPVSHILFAGPPGLIGRFVDVVVTEARPHSLRGRLVAAAAA